MKKILLSLIFILTTFLSYSQTYTIASIDTSNLVPKYLLLDNPNGTKDTLGVLVTIKQAQKINTDLEILQLYIGLHNDCDSVIQHLSQTVTDYKAANEKAEQAIKAADSTLKIRDLQVTNLNQQLEIKKTELAYKDSTIVAKDSLITIANNESKKFKKQRNHAIWGCIAEGLVILGLISAL